MRCLNINVSVFNMIQYVTFKVDQSRVKSAKDMARRQLRPEATVADADNVIPASLGDVSTQ